MKTSVLILIFSGAIGLNKCNSDLNVSLPGFRFINSVEMPDNSKSIRNDSVDTKTYNYETTINK
ncbi:MAG: hypothetical protein NTZ33_06640 [Bacteroidetes bacterium]|nr:hypothetical protein [Bacteroidota bacterium]